MVNVQEWLTNQEKYNTKEKTTKIKTLNISNKDLEGFLDLTNFENLEELDCSINRLIDLDVSKCSNLAKLNCSYTLLSNLDFLMKLPNPKKLTFLNLSECNNIYLPQKKMLDVLASFDQLSEENKQEIIQEFSFVEKNKTENLCQRINDQFNNLYQIVENKLDNEGRKLLKNWKEGKTEQKLDEIIRGRGVREEHRIKMQELKEIANVLFQLQAKLEQQEKELEDARQQSLFNQLKLKSNQLEQLFILAKSKVNNKTKSLLDKLLTFQEIFTKEGTDSLDEKEIETLIDSLKESLSESEIINLCRKKRETIYLTEVIQANQEELENSIKTTSYYEK